MIRITKKFGSAIPNHLQTVGAAQTVILINNADAGKFDYKFNSAIYGHSEVKNSLIELQDYKCCFCESKIGHISYGDVEHFRPKGGWIQDTETLNQPGYYWLAYAWDNLLLSCQKCNQRYKRNFFPLVNNATRNINTRDISAELPLFINPVNENPEDFISFNEEIPIAIDENIRGVETVNKLRLDRELLNEQRRQKLNMLRDIYDLAKGYPETPQKGNARNKVQKYLDESKLDETEYASMMRAFFRKNPIDF